MTERSLFWDGEVLGDCGPYTQLHLQDYFFRSILNATGDKGVVRGWRNELEVTGTTSPISVASGGAVVYGMPFDVDVASSFAVSTPASGNSRYDRIVVRRTWATQVVRLARVSGVAAAAAPAVPALTQTAFVTWEIPIATLLIDDAGTITVTDARDFLAFPTAYWANIVEAGMYEEGAVTADKRPDRTRRILKGAKQIQPDSGAPCTWTAGPPYEHWQFADAAFNRGWALFGGKESIVGGTVDFYVWSVPHVNGAGGGAETCQWDYSIYYSNAAGTPTNAAGNITPDQQARLNTTVYADQIVAGLTVGANTLVAFRLSRDGAADSYNSPMRLLGIEMRWTADA